MNKTIKHFRTLSLSKGTSCHFDSVGIAVRKDAAGYAMPQLSTGNNEWDGVTRL